MDFERESMVGTLQVDNGRITTSSDSYESSTKPGSSLNAR